jgi:glycosyltransferase involved in cell wall biosynthesis
VSSNLTWGGSEQLWCEAAERLARRGHRVITAKPNASADGTRSRFLRDAGVPLRELSWPPVPGPVEAFLQRLSRPLSILRQIAGLRLALLGRRPDLVVISQGGNYDAVLLVSLCRRLKMPYVLISQKATDLYWPPDVIVPRMRDAFAGALVPFFVSTHNLRLTEEQIGAALPRARVVRNPFYVSWKRRADWPTEDGAFRFACVGRLHPGEKGQDLLLRVLAMEKWRSRPLTVTFFGGGPHGAGLKAMAAHARLDNVKFAGFVDDIDSIWGEHHGLILPSRCEGLPLVLVEALLSGRVAIVTDIAGNHEVVRDEETGFLAATPTEASLDDAMERAWQRRDEWRTIGARAAEEIRKLVPEDPAGDFATMLETIARTARG